MRIQWTKAASGDLDSIEEYISQDNPKAAVRQVLRIVKAVEENLSSMPEMGRSGRLPDTREYVIAGTPYFVVYRFGNESLEILRVIHGARQWP